MSIAIEDNSEMGCCQCMLQSWEYGCFVETDNISIYNRLLLNIL